MSNRRTVIYLNQNLLETILLFPEDYPELYNLFCYYSEICIDLTDNELDDILTDPNNDITQFISAHDIKLIALPGYLSRLKENPQEMMSSNRCVFFLDVSPEEAISLSQHYGIIVQSLKEPCDSLWGPSFRKTLSKGDQFSWEDLFQYAKLCPSNSIVINDAYLFSNESGVLGENNVLALLKNLLPKSFSAMFHILIVCQHPDCADSRCNQIVGQLKAKLNALFNYEIALEVFFHPSALHKRRIFMGYQTILCDKGFCIFQKQGKDVFVRDDNEFELRPMFDLRTRDYGDSQYYVDSVDLNNIRKNCKDAGIRYKANHSDPDVQLAGDYNRNSFSALNRLVNSV